MRFGAHPTQRWITDPEATVINTIWDGTAPGTEQHTLGPGNPGVLHAFPPNSRISLCGHIRSDNTQPQAGRRCQACIALAGQRHWIGR